MTVSADHNNSQGTRPFPTQIGRKEKSLHQSKKLVGVGWLVVGWYLKYWWKPEEHSVDGRRQPPFSNESATEATHDDQEADLVMFSIWELQRQLRRLNVKGTDPGLSSLDEIWPVL